MTMSEDQHVIQCNYATATKSVPAGARAYVLRTNPGNGNDRIVVLARSRGARWIETWVSIAHLRDFRVKTIPPDHPMYDQHLLPAEHGAELIS